jgi:hypothetical protein
MMRAIALASQWARGYRNGSTRNALFAGGEAIAMAWAAPAQGCPDVRRCGSASPSAATRFLLGRRLREPTGCLCRRSGSEVSA